MKDQDVIRRALGLADGWDLTEGQLTLPSGHFFMLAGPTDWRQFMLDALAAQLVRQVDAIGHQWHVVIDDDHTRIVEGSYVTHKRAAKGQDRTMNTLRAIVESGVLTDTSAKGSSD